MIVLTVIIIAAVALTAWMVVVGGYNIFEELTMMMRIKGKSFY